VNSAAPNLERARQLLAELKALFDDLPQESRDTVSEQFTYCARNCVPAAEDAYA
jgi:hypothetical protein